MVMLANRLADRLVEVKTGKIGEILANVKGASLV